MTAPPLTFDEDKDRVNQELYRWHTKIEAALRLAENQLRHQQNLPDYHGTVFIPEQESQLLQLLNWKVWCQRYHLRLEILLAILLRHYSYNRRPDRKQLCLGLPIGLLTGDTCRRRLEEELTKMYPNGENLQAARNERTPDPLPEVVDPNRYDQVMTQRHRQSLREPVSRRSWRRG